MSENPRWPWPRENELERARRIATAYRQHLKTANPTLCASLDEAMVTYGELWVVDVTMVHEPEDAITTAEAAELAGVTPELIRHWARLPHPDDPDRMLLPRFKRRGREMTYLVADVDKARDAYPRTRHATT